MRELWAELSATMRALRQNAGMSLRKVEIESGVGRGTLSQYETAKARPNRDVVEWYDRALGGDGLLSSLYAEARGARGPHFSRSHELATRPGDAMQVLDNELPFGALVAPGATVWAGWTLHNTGSVPWRARALQRVGARAGTRLVSSDAGLAVPDCGPGDRVRCRVRLGVPATAATYVAGWQMVDENGSPALPFDAALSVHIVVHHV